MLHLQKLACTLHGRDSCLCQTLQYNTLRARAGVLAEVINPEDGSMARTPQLLEFAREHGLKCITVAQLVRYRLSTEGLPAADGPSPQGSANGAGQNGAGQ